MIIVIGIICLCLLMILLSNSGGNVHVNNHPVTKRPKAPPPGQGKCKE